MTQVLLSVTLVDWITSGGPGPYGAIRLAAIIIALTLGAIVLLTARKRIKP